MRARDRGWGGLRTLLALLAGLPALGALALSAFLGAGNFLAAPAQAPVTADLIVSLGGDGGQRAQKAVELYRAGFSRHVLLTGLATPPMVDPATEWRARMLRRQGVPQNAMLFDGVATNSWEEAERTLQVMRANGWNRVMVVSDPPHLRRLQWAWGRVFAGSGKQFVLVAADLRGWNGDAWWKDPGNAHYVRMEFTKLAYYVATKRARPLGPA